MKSIVFLALTLCCSAALSLELERMVGYAYDQKTEELLYLERHQRWFDGGRIRYQAVDYLDPEGTLFAQKTLSYDDAQERPNFALIDRRTGHIETLTYDENGYRVGACKGVGQSWRENIIDQKDFVADAGFDRMIIARWDELMGGARIELPFLIPIAAKTVPFRLKMLATNPDSVTFRMSPRSWLVRMLVAPIDVSYSKSDKRLLSYRGLSNLHNDRLKNFKVSIEFPAAEHTRESVTEFATADVPAFGDLKAQALDL